MNDEVTRRGYVYKVSAEREKHYCPLPTEDEREEIGLVVGDVWQCALCLRPWRFAPIPWEREWVPVHWWNFRVRRRMRNGGFSGGDELRRGT